MSTSWDPLCGKELAPFRRKARRLESLATIGKMGRMRPPPDIVKATFRTCDALNVAFRTTRAGRVVSRSWSAGAGENAWRPAA